MNKRNQKIKIEHTALKGGDFAGAYSLPNTFAIELSSESVTEFNQGIEVAGVR